MHHATQLSSSELITILIPVCMVTAYWDGDVEYFSLWYYHGCLKYWLRVLKPAEVIGMHVRTHRLSTSFIYRFFWCNSMGEKVNKTWFKDKFTLTTVLWHKAQIIVSKILFSSETHSLSFLKLFTQARRKGLQGDKRYMGIINSFNLFWSNLGQNPCANREKSRHTTES